MQDNAHAKIDKWLESAESKIFSLYDNAAKRIKTEMARYFKTFQKMDDEKRELLETEKITKKEYTRWRKKTIMQNKLFAELKNSLAGILLYYNRRGIELIKNRLEWAYSQGFDEINIPDVVHSDALQTAEIPYIDYIVDDKKADKWNKKKIESLVLNGIVAGYTLTKISRIAVKIAYMNAHMVVNNARTFVTGAENKGREDSYKIVEGADKAEKVQYLKKWVTVEDSHVRHAHIELHGQVVGLDEPFENSLGKIWFPGDPSSIPANRHGCRCHTELVAIGNNGVQVSIKFPKKVNVLDIDILSKKKYN